MNRIDRDALLEVVRAHAPRSLHAAEICSRLGLDKRDLDLVLGGLDNLVSLGLVKEMPGRRFRISKEARRDSGRTAKRDSSPGGRPSAIEGRITVHPHGFGFVSADDGGPDVFIAAPNMESALQGDKVRVHARPSRKGREGEVLGVIERGITIVTGTLRRAAGNVWIDPDDPRVRGPMRVDGEARGVRSGAPVIAEIIHYPRDSRETPEVRVTELLGAAGITEVEVRKLKIKHGVVEDFPASVLKEASRIPDRVSEQDRRGREDLRNVDLVTIDPDDARDHDDAVWAERVKRGYRVIIAIADVSAYVVPGTAIDDEALARSCSIYLPDRAIPMLPRELSSTLASLLPEEDRLTLAVECMLDETGRVRSHRYIEGVMRSKARLTYGGVARAMQLAETPPSELDRENERRAKPFLPLLDVLFEVSGLLGKRRSKRGSLDFDLPEARVVLDEARKEPVDIIRSRKDPGIRKAYNMIEELMLLANEVVATDLEERGIPAVYRVHGKPDQKKLEQFSAVARAFGHDLDADEASDPKTLQAFLKKIANQPESNALSYLMLRAMQQATYDTTNVGHFGLALKSYLHFTSPIRRYPDLAVHRVVRSLVRKERIDNERLLSQLRTVSVESSRLERRAMELERDVVDLYRCVLLRDRVGDEIEATITGVAEHGFYSTLDKPFVEALTPVEALGAGGYEIDQLGLRLRSRFSGHSYGLGDRLTLRIEEVSIERRQIIALPKAVAERMHEEIEQVGAQFEEAVRWEEPAKPARPGKRRPDHGRPERPVRRGDDRRDRDRGPKRGGPSRDAEPTRDAGPARQPRAGRAPAKAPTSKGGKPMLRVSGGNKPLPASRSNPTKKRGGPKGRKKR